MGSTWLTEPQHIVDLLASEYGNVETVEFQLGEAGKVEGPGLHCARETDRGLSLIDTKLRSMPSLKNIVATIWEERDDLGYGTARLIVSTALGDSMAERGSILEKVETLASVRDLKEREGAWMLYWSECL